MTPTPDAAPAAPAAAKPPEPKPDPKPEISEMMAKARAAMKAIEHYDQAQADMLVMAIGWAVVKEKEALARLAVEEGGFGNIEDKITKIRLRVTGTIQDMKSIKTVGVVEVDEAKQLVKIAKPAASTNDGVLTSCYMKGEASCSC